MAVVTELVTKFTFKGSVKPLADFNAALGKSIKLLAASAVGLGLGKIALDNFVVSTLKSAEGAKKLSVDTGISAEKLQEMGYAASVSGSDVETFTSTLISLQAKIGDAAQKGSADFARLGISVRDSFGNIKKTDQVLEEIAQRFKDLNLSLPQQQSIAQSLGIDNTLLALLAKSADEMEVLKKTARDLGVVTTAQYKKIYEFNNSITTLKYGLNSLVTQISIGLSPAIKEITDKFTGWLVKNKDLIKNGVEAVASVVGALFKAIKRLFTFVSDIIEATIGWKAALIALGVVLAVVLSPVYLITAAIIAVLAIVDDLIVAFKGGKSVIRDFFMEFFGFDIAPVLKELVAGFLNAIAIIKQAFKDVFGWVIDSIKFIAKIINKSIELLSPDVAQLSSSNGVSGNNGSSKSLIPSAASMIPDYTNIPGSGGNKEINQNIKIDIKTNDAQAAGKAVTDGLQNQLQNANAQLNKGGR